MPLDTPRNAGARAQAAHAFATCSAMGLQIFQILATPLKCSNSFYKA